MCDQFCSIRVRRRPGMPPHSTSWLPRLHRKGLFSFLKPDVALCLISVPLAHEGIQTGNDHVGFRRRSAWKPLRAGWRPRCISVAFLLRGEPVFRIIGICCAPLYTPPTRSTMHKNMAGVGWDDGRKPMPIRSFQKYPDHRFQKLITARKCQVPVWLLVPLPRVGFPSIG